MAENPRTFLDTLGYFITCDSRRMSPDEHKPHHNAIKDIVQQTGDEAKDQAEHIELIKKQVSFIVGHEVIAIYPVTTYEHSSISYTLGTRHGFDSSNNSFYIVTEKSAETLDTPPAKFEEVIKQELSDYTAWANGSIYQYELYDKDGTLEDSGSGFYSIEEIGDNLPKEWKDEVLSNYVIND